MPPGMVESACCRWGITIRREGVIMIKENLGVKDRETFELLEREIPGVELVDFFDSGSTSRVFHARVCM
jgi:hypothetical protein